MPEQPALNTNLPPPDRDCSRLPAVPIAACFAAGILADSWMSFSWPVWLTASTVGLLAWMGCFIARMERAAVGFLLLSCLAVGGARHHRAWSVARDDDISQYVTFESRPVRLRGCVSTAPVIRPKESDWLSRPWSHLDRSDCTLQCEQIHTDGYWSTVSGTARLSVLGHLLHVHEGDRVEVFGRIKAPAGPMNPGQFDFATYLRRSEIRALVWSEGPDSVRLLATQPQRELQRFRSRIRDACEFILVQHLSPRTLPVASALLLGNRSQLTDDVRSTFVDSGTMHILAISGLHVGILAFFLWAFCRWFQLSPAVTSVVLIVSVSGYAFLTDAHPPALRAAILTSVLAAGLPLYRRAPAANVLAVAAIVVLVRNPTDLFDTGAQLSFIGVAAMLCCGTWWAKRRRIRAQALLNDSAESQGRIRRLVRRIVSATAFSYCLSGAVWLATAPLILASFHLVAVVGLLINVLIFPLLVIVLGLGFSLLICGFLLPEVASIPGTGCNLGLSWLMNVVEYAAAVDWGHVYMPAAAAWWLAGFYGLLAGLFLWTHRPRRTFWIVRGLLAWLVLGLAVGLWPNHPAGLRATFLSVGHGCSILVELPNGRTMLYDAGRLESGYVAQHIIENALWQRGCARIDALVLSHADSDHFNAVPGLARTVPIGCVVSSKPFFNSQETDVMRLTEAVDREHIPIRIIGRGDRLKLDDGVVIEVLHPYGDDPSTDDNANSLVLSVQYAGRRILLTGDLENSGLSSVLATPPLHADILLSPHHGGQRANPGELADWARPEWVVVSAGRPGVPQRLRAIYGPQSQILSTRELGAITFQISPKGVIKVHSYFANRAHPMHEAAPNVRVNSTANR